MSSSFASSILSSLDTIRGIAGVLGLRPFTVSITVRTWSGVRAGQGNRADVATTFGVSAGTQPPKVRFVSQKDILASAGKYVDGDIRVGPLTPSYPGGGTTPASFEPALGFLPTEIFWSVTGPTLPASGAWCDKIGEETDSALHYYVVLRRGGKTP